MTTTILLEDPTHILVEKKRIELREKGIRVSLKKITEDAIVKGLPLIDDEYNKNKRVI